MVGQWHLSSYIKSSIIVTSLYQKFYSKEKVEKESCKINQTETREIQRCVLTAIILLTGTIMPIQI